MLRSLFTVLFLAIVMSDLTACATQHSPQTTIAASDDLVSRMGRAHVNADGSQTFGFPGVSFTVNAEGSRLIARMKSTAGNSPPSVN